MQYQIEGFNLKYVTEIKDLGIIFDQQLSFVPRINFVVS